MSRQTAKNVQLVLNRIDFVAEQQALLELKANVQAEPVKRMIDLAIEAGKKGIPRLGPEDISELLGRDK
ncbi:MAG: hypothetical protein HOP19_04855 [Acidobacteria bacterium]|nr:hypothetical protein [Acidobacteriota bacterium]